MYSAYIIRLKNLRLHPNAHSLKIGEALGNQVIVGLDYNEDDLYLYFPTDGVLSDAYCKQNKLYRSDGGYLEDGKGRVRTCKLRKEVSDGLVMKLDSLKGLVPDDVISGLRLADRFSELGSIKLCEKYVTPATRNRSASNGPKKLKNRAELPLFRKHIDTEQLAFSAGDLKAGDVLVISVKNHGTSARTAYIPVDVELPKWKQLINKYINVFPTQEYKTVSGTRNVIITYETNVVNDGIRREINKYLEGKLNKNECIFYEICGYDGDAPIMPPHDNKKIGDDKFVKRYGAQTVYSYGCKPGEYRLFLYRVAYMTPEGYTIDLPASDVARRAEELGMYPLIELDRFVYDGDFDSLLNKCKELAEGKDPLGDHIREGVCIRRDSSSKIKIFKMKGIGFKILENIAKDSDVYCDPEESS